MLENLKANNRAWAARKVAADAGFFKRLEGQQGPEYLWIGCSDSRVPANEIVDLDPGELFVHRNVANLAPPQDANYLSVLQFAVDVIKVKHIMVVGHYGCGGVAAAVDGKRRGLVDHWLHPIREVAHDHQHELDAIPEEKQRLNRLCELNVIRQVRNVASDVFVQDAWARGQPLSVHGWVYSLSNGLVNDLEVTVSSPEEAERLGMDKDTGGSVAAASDTIGPVVRTVTVPVPPQQAFAIFVGEIGRWWPKSFTVGQAPMAIETRKGGRWFEVGPDGKETLWGEVLAWEPPGRLLLGWRRNADWRYDPDLDVEVEMTFAPAGGGTEVRLEHRNLEAFGTGAAEAVARFGGQGGWAVVLGSYAELAAKTAR